MAQPKMTPFEQAVCAWVLKLPSTWTTINWDALTASHEKAFIRLIKGGFIEGRLPVVLRIEGTAPIRTVWRVVGNYSSMLEQQIKAFLGTHGHGGKRVGMICEEFTAGRLTDHGEWAKRDFLGDHEFRDDGDNRPGLPKVLFDLVAGGPDGEGGAQAAGVAKLASAETITASQPAAAPAPTVTMAQANAHATANVDMAPVGKGLEAIAEALGRRNGSDAPDAPAPAAAKGAGPGTTTSGSELRSMTQAEVDQAIAEYKARRASIYNDLKDAVRRSRPEARREARKLFGRNALWRAIGCRSKTMVTNSPEYRKIQSELGLEPQRRRQRTGLEPAADEAGEAAGDYTFQNVIAKETIQLIRRHLSGELADELIQKVELGEITDAAARKIVEAHQEQQKDARSRRIHSGQP